MKLISCDNCGVMLDADKLHFPHNIRDDLGCVDDSRGMRSSDKRDWVPYVDYPVCSEPIEGEAA